MFYQTFSDLIMKKISDKRPESFLLVFEISGEGPHFRWTGRENFLSIRLWQMSVTLSWWPRRDCPASSGFSRLDATL